VGRVRFAARPQVKLVVRTERERSEAFGPNGVADCVRWLGSPRFRPGRHVAESLETSGQ